MKKLILLFFVFIITIRVNAQDSCSGATELCANSKVYTYNIGATASVTDPALSCGDHNPHHTVWFTVTAINNDSATITVSAIDNNPGLEMEVYTGTCGSLVSTGHCAAGVGPSGSMSVTFNTSTGIVYYIMVDGTSGNTEAFNIMATSISNSIVQRPVSTFNSNPIKGCVPLSVMLHNTSGLYGGNLTLQWRFDTASFIPSSGADTSITFLTPGTHAVEFTASNECGGTAAFMSIVAQERPFADFSLFADTIQLHHYIAINNSSGLMPLSYDWSWGDGTHDTIPYPNHIYNDSGYYDICLTVKDSIGCTTTFCDSSFHIQRTTNYLVYVNVIPPIILGTKTKGNEVHEINIYPNPTASELILHNASFVANSSMRILIRNILGETQKEEKLNWYKREVKINVTTLPKGIYFLQINTENEIFIKKFIKE